MSGTITKVDKLLAKVLESDLDPLGPVLHLANPGSIEQLVWKFAVLPSGEVVRVNMYQGKSRYLVARACCGTELAPVRAGDTLHKVKIRDDIR